MRHRTINTSPARRRRAGRVGLLTLCLLTTALLAGCQVAGVIGSTWDATKEVDIPAEYRGLDGKRVVVLVDAPMDIYYEFPGITSTLTLLISNGIIEYCPGSLVPPTEEVIAFQYNNVYWATMDYAELCAELRTERIVIIDLIEYRLQAPGNSYLWDGRISADVHVIEADSFDPSSFAYSKRVLSLFPGIEGVSRESASQAQIAQGLQIKFAQKVVRLFHDHKRINSELQDEKRLEG
ncbi:MAG: hypothetical protein ACF8PN_10240 [Phycisphaerales bacterium]